MYREIRLLPERQQLLKKPPIDLQKKVDAGHMQEGRKKHFPHRIVRQVFLFGGLLASDFPEDPVYTVVQVLTGVIGLRRKIQLP